MYIQLSHISAQLLQLLATEELTLVLTHTHTHPSVYNQSTHTEKLWLLIILKVHFYFRMLQYIIFHNSIA